MALTIKNAEAERLSRELADLTGETITSAVTAAVQDRLTRVRSSRLTPQTQAERILELGRSIAAALPRDGLQLEDLYDERGLPA